MNYAIKLWRGADAEAFLQQWAAGGVVIRPDVIGAFYGARGAHSLSALRQEAAAWELEEIRLGLRELLQAAFSPGWVWTDALWMPAERDRLRLEEDEHHARLRRLLGRPLTDRDREEALRAVVALARRYGPLQAVRGRVGDNPVSVHATGIVSYERTPHPVGFLRTWIDRLYPEVAP